MVNYTAIIAAVVTVGGAVSVALGHPALAAVFNDPNTATEITAIVSAGSGLVSAFSGAVHKPKA